MIAILVDQYLWETGILGKIPDFRSYIEFFSNYPG